MIETIIKTAITFIISGSLGYCVSAIKNYKKKLEEKKKEQESLINSFIEKLEKLETSQLVDMRNDLTNKFYVYDNLEKVEDFLVMAFREKCEDYFERGGDSWIHPMYDKSFKWKIKPTEYLK